ncbi:hypothetical protein Cal7507_3765 [Calothrix sp. PCC 7507]|nr:hypothetical protein Cal7507_3765 [Calothrix sp. PCC 7507]
MIIELYVGWAVPTKPWMWWALPTLLLLLLLLRVFQKSNTSSIVDIKLDFQSLDHCKLLHIQQRCIYATVIELDYTVV